ncbi:TIGR00270 family protein [Candidatus Woesearchaeota archaeon]|nr:TIGR00270 family protein [Candidatus Woesearchaeota archaeon]
MALCEMCGKDEELVKASVEGVILNVCRNCGKFGKIIAVLKPAPKAVKREKPKEAEKEVVESVVPGYSGLIKMKREKLGLKQEELAKRLSEKESLLHKIESGKTVPSITLAKKIEKFLKISLVEVKEEEALPLRGGKADVTLGDMVKIRKR